MTQLQVIQRGPQTRYKAKPGTGAYFRENKLKRQPEHRLRSAWKKKSFYVSSTQQMLLKVGGKYRSQMENLFFFSSFFSFFRFVSKVNASGSCSNRVAVKGRPCEKHFCLTFGEISSRAARRAKHLPALGL